MIEKLLRLIADQNKLAAPEDELSRFITHLDDMDDEMDEFMLEEVAAAKLDISQIPE